MTSTGRVARLTALALATGTLVAAGAGTAGAASTNTKTAFTATGGGSVIRLTINIPSQLAPLTGAVGLPQTLTQDIVLTGGAVRTSDVKAIATSMLGANGNVPVLKDLLNKSVVAEYGKPAPAAYSLLPQELKDGLAGFGIHVKALELNSKANNPVVDGAVSHSLSTIADLQIDGAGVLDQILGALNGQISAILSTALGTQTASQTDALGGVTSTVGNTVTGLVGTLTDQLDALTQNTTAPLSDAVKQAIETVVAQLNALPNLLSQTITTAAEDTSLLKIGLIESEQAVDRAAGVVTSTSTNKLVGVSVLGGLVTVDGLTSAASAALGNGVSEATADKGQNAILKVSVKDVLTATLGSDLGIDLTSDLLPAEVVGAVQGALDQVTNLLNGVLGATLTQTKLGEQIETPDHAASSVSAARLVVNPTLPGLGTALFDKPLLDISFVPAEADVVKAQSATPPTVVTTPSKSTSHQFAPTGANFGLTAPIAVTLMGLAVVARRRRLAHLG
jgi:hypothetical protein